MRLLETVQGAQGGKKETEMDRRLRWAREARATRPVYKQDGQEFYIPKKNLEKLNE